MVKTRCNGIMDSALACCAGGPGSTPTVGIKKMEPDTIIGAI